MRVRLPTHQWGRGYDSSAKRTQAHTYSNASGLKTGETSFVGRLVSAYTYTNSGRLATASIDITDNGDASDAFTESYTFDAAGNLTSDGTRTYVYDSNRLAQTKIGTEVQTYFFFDSDKRWRTVQAPTSSESDPNRTTYAYTGTGRLSEFKKYSGGSVAAQGTYQYDSVGQRTRSTVTAGGIQTTTDFTYTGLTLHKLEAEEKQGETTLAKWTITYLYDEYGRPYAGIYRDTTDPENPATPVTFALVTTDRGDVVELLDANGTPFAAYRYDAWGNPIGAGNVGTGLWAQATTQGETETISLEVATKIASRQVLRYAGYCYDSESGMYYLSARHYDPATRQFLSKDLSRNDGEQSAYQYCGGNPIKNVDPTGYFSWDPRKWFKSAGRGIKRGFCAAYRGVRHAITQDLNPVSKHNVFRQDGWASESMPYWNPMYGIAASTYKAGEAGYRGNFKDAAVEGSTAIAETVILGMMAGAGLPPVDPIAAGSMKMMNSAAKAAEAASKETAESGVQYTKSTLRLGQDMHKAYRADMVDEANQQFKEFILPSNRRIDFLDAKNGIVYELKPFNPRGMKAGAQQLDTYVQELESMDRFAGKNWTTVLDLY